MKQKKLLWMFAPCLLLLGVGAYFSHCPALPAKSNGFQLVVEGVKALPTSRHGDSKIVVTARLKSFPPEEEPTPKRSYLYRTRLRLSYLKNGKEIEIPIDQSGIIPQIKDLKPQEKGYAANWAEVPASCKQINLRLSAYCSQVTLGRFTRTTPVVSVVLPLRRRSNGFFGEFQASPATAK